MLYVVVCTSTFRASLSVSPTHTWFVSVYIFLVSWMSDSCFRIDVAFAAFSKCLPMHMFQASLFGPVLTGLVLTTAHSGLLWRWQAGFTTTKGKVFPKTDQPENKNI